MKHRILFASLISGLVLLLSGRTTAAELTRK